MKNRKNTILVIALVSVLTLMTGCGITITRNQYYSYPDQNTEIEHNKKVSKCTADTLTIYKNERK